MASDVKWIKITTDVFDDEKILLIESLPAADSIIVIWFKLLCLAGKQNNSGVFVMGDRIPYTDKMLATIFRRDESVVRLALSTFEEFGMIELIDGVITIPNWGKHQSLEQIEARKEYQREYQREYRQKQKLLAVKNDEEENKPLRKHSRKQNVNSPEGEKKENKSKKKSIKEEQLDLFEKLRFDYILSDAVTEKMREWITYKVERKDTYQETGMKALLRKIENNRLNYGDDAVCELIDECMSNNWKGIIFDILQNKPKKNNQQKKTDLDGLF